MFVVTSGVDSTFEGTAVDPRDGGLLGFDEVCVVTFRVGWLDGRDEEFNDGGDDNFIDGCDEEFIDGGDDDFNDGCDEEFIDGGDDDFNDGGDDDCNDGCNDGYVVGLAVVGEVITFVSKSRVTKPLLT